MPELAAFLLRSPGGLPRGDGHPVIVYPGFLASDLLTRALRRQLRRLGYNVRGWGFGANLGLKHGLLTGMVLNAKKLNGVTRRKVSLVGWSLGGLYAREVAKRAPEAVRQVITLGTPCAGNMRANNAWKLYEALNDHKVDAPPIDTDLAEPPPVPITSIYSPRDGIVAPGCSAIGTGEARETLEVDSTHIGLAWNAEVLRIIADRLAQPEGTWRPMGWASSGSRPSTSSGQAPGKRIS